MKIEYKPLCEGATAIAADAVLKDYGDVKEVCSECGVPVGEDRDGVNTAEQVIDDALNWFTAGAKECAARNIIRYSDAVPVIEAAKLEAKAQLESIMQDYAIEARIDEKDFFMKYIDVDYTECHGLKCRLLWCGSCCGEDEAEEESAKAQKTINEHIAKLEQLRTTNQTLKGEE